MLHHKLEAQPIVNDALIHRVVSRNAARINRDAITIVLVAIIGIPYCVWLFLYLGVSWLFTLITVVFFAAAIVYTHYTHRPIRPVTLVQCTPADITHRIARMKRLYAHWLRFSIPFLVCWIAWFAYEIVSLSAVSQSERTSILIGGAIGAAVGAVLGIVAYRRTQRLANEILEQTAP